MPVLEPCLPVWEATFPADLDVAAYSNRTISPEETVRRLWPELEQLGITRVARQTGLDRIGIPVWASFRPNSKSLSGAQGKGLSDAAACASAVMEAAEVAIAENPGGERSVTTGAALKDRGARWFDPTRLLPVHSAFDLAAKVTWIVGTDLVSRANTWVPIDAVDMDGESSEVAGICKTSNGLASGNTDEEATFHGLCELIERDATTLWSLLSGEKALATAFRADSLMDASVDLLEKAIEAAGLQVTLFDQTSDLGVPVVMAVLGPQDTRRVTKFQITAGYGAHPVAAHAALRAITEAAQSRITAIAGSRDDIESGALGNTPDEGTLSLLKAHATARPPTGTRRGLPLQVLLADTIGVLAAHDCGAIAVPLGHRAMPFSVVKIVSAELEDRDANINWRPGSRCFAALAQ